MVPAHLHCQSTSIVGTKIFGLLSICKRAISQDIVQCDFKIVPNAFPFHIERYGISQYEIYRLLRHYVCQLCLVDITLFHNVRFSLSMTLVLKYEA